MKLDALEHPKILDFAARLGVSRPTALGHLELLWAFTGKHAAQGDIGKWPDGAIARACDWMGDPQSFLQSLLQSGLIDAHPEHRYVIHDWNEHAPRWVRAKLAKLQLDFVTPSGKPEIIEATVVATAERTNERSSADCSSDSVRVEKCREEKGREGRRARARDTESPPVEGLDAQAWERWLDYRKQIRKPLKPVSIPAAQRKLAAFGADQAAVVEQSIANSWQGLFPLKTGTHVSRPPPAASPPNTPYQRMLDSIRAAGYDPESLDDEDDDDD